MFTYSTSDERLGHSAFTQLPSICMSGKTTSSVGISITVFRTSLQTKQDVSMLEPRFTTIPRLISWTVDLEDCDHVLRLVGLCLDINQIKELIQQAGFSCEELDN